MKVKTSELQGAALDWAVAKCEGEAFLVLDGKVFIPDWEGVDEPYHYHPSGSYNDGGPIIEREKIALWLNGDDDWAATDGFKNATGPTPLIAAMRCYVASQLGDEADVPNELMEV